jgi:hypothetical protein
VGGAGFSFNLIACGVVILAIIAIICANVSLGPYLWIFLTTFFFLFLIGGLLYKKLETDRLKRETAFAKNCQAVIRAINDQFESQINAGLKIRNMSPNVSCEEFQQIIQNIDQGLEHLNQQYKRSLDTIQTSSDEALFEQIKNNFHSHAMTNQEKLVNSSQEIDQLDFLLSQQNLIRMFNEHTEPLMKKIQQLMEACKLSIWTSKLNALKSELDSSMVQMVSRVETATEEIQLLKTKYEVESLSRECGMKLQELERMIEQKESMLKNINACFSEVESKYLRVLDSLPNTSDQDFLDIEKLKAKVDPVKAEADHGYQGK